MKYYKLIPKIGEGQDSKAYIFNEGIDVKSISHLLQGKKIENVDSKKITLKNTTKQFPDLMGTGTSVFFLSEKLKTIIEDMENPENLNFIPVKLKNKNYWILNILNNIQCFDWENSEYIVRKHNSKVLKKVSKLALKQECVGSRNVFRIEEQYMYVLISQKLKEAIEEHDLSGVGYDSTFEIVTI